MIRQAINCDMCGTERVEATSHWFVADEIKGEVRLRGWSSGKKTRRGARHLCGQKCVQRMIDNFTAALVADQQAGRAAAAREIAEVLELAPAPPSPPAITTHRETVAASADSADQDNDLPLLQRMGYDRTTVEEIEAESWAGPVRYKEETAPAPAAPKPGVATSAPASTPVNPGWGANLRGNKVFIPANRLREHALKPFRTA